jgi:hypothetical protein
VRVIREARGIEFWTAWSDGKMVAFVVTVDTPWGCEFVLTRSVHMALKLYPNNALIYTVTKRALERGAELVSLGLSSYAGETRGLHNFKVNMGYEAISLAENQAWHPIVRPFRPLLEPDRLRAIYRMVSRAS